MTSIIDTNVILVANGQHNNVGPDCFAACALRLQTIMSDHRIALDEGFEILQEYQNKTRSMPSNRTGDAFVKWALRNRVNPRKCDLVALKPHSGRVYDSFPEDARLENFDPPDRKFVAVSAAHPEHPTILQAADSKWIDWEPALKGHDISVEFLCPADIQRFHDNKFGK